jgi:hypothetical protein
VSTRGRKDVTALDGAIALMITLLVVQMWLVTASLESTLAGHHETALPGAIVSGILFGICLLLYRFVRHIDADHRR